MLFMVVENFLEGADAVGERFAAKGRMLPDGVTYENSWVQVDGSRCFQLMRAPDRGSLDTWIARWSDLVAFEVVPVVTSQAFWSART